MGFEFRSTLPVGSPAREYFADYAAQRAAWLADRGGFDQVADDEGVVQLVERPRVEKGRGVKIVKPKVRVGDDELGTAAKKTYKAAVALGLEVRCWLVVTDVEAVLYVADSKEGDKSEHRAGDVRYPQRFERRYTVEAKHPLHPLGFQSTYVGEGLEGTTGGFETARIRDPLGIPVENWADYTKDKVIADALGWNEERRIQEGMAANRRINDGSSRIERIRYFTVGGDFTRWLDEWLTQKGLPTITPKRKPKATPEEKEQAIMSGGEWNG